MGEAGRQTRGEHLAVAPHTDHISLLEITHIQVFHPS